MLRHACQRTGLFMPGTTALVGNVSELKENQLYLSRGRNSLSPKALWLKFGLIYSLTRIALIIFFMICQEEKLTDSKGSAIIE